MIYSTMFAAATAATLAAASPLKSRQTTETFSVTNFGYGCSPGGCAWGFNVSAPAYSDEFPAFTDVYCSGTTYSTDYVDCAPIASSAMSTHSESVSAWINGTSTPLELYIKYEVDDSAQGSRYDYYGETGVQSTGHCTTCPTEYSVPVVSSTAVA